MVAVVSPAVAETQSNWPTTKINNNNNNNNNNKNQTTTTTIDLLNSTLF